VAIDNTGAVYVAGAYSVDKPVAPSAPPKTPTAPAATAGNDAADLTWAEPDNGGSLITGYSTRYSSNNGTTWTTGSTATGTSATITAARAGSTGSRLPCRSPQIEEVA